MRRKDDEPRRPTERSRSTSPNRSTPRGAKAPPSAQSPRKAGTPLTHSLRAASDADFDDADADSCTVAHRRNDKVSDS